MAQIINLQKVRKQRARAEKAVQAEENRIKFGRTKADRKLTEAEQAMADKHIDAHKRDDED